MALEDSTEKLEQLEQDAREMGVPGDIIRARRPEVIKKMNEDDKEELSEVRQLDEQRLEGEVSEFAVRTSEDMSHHSETGKPLDEPSEQK